MRVDGHSEIVLHLTWLHEMLQSSYLIGGGDIK